MRALTGCEGTQSGKADGPCLLAEGSGEARTPRCWQKASVRIHSGVGAVPPCLQPPPSSRKCWPCSTRPWAAEGYSRRRSSKGIPHQQQSRPCCRPCRRRSQVCGGRAHACTGAQGLHPCTTSFPVGHYTLHAPCSLQVWLRAKMARSTGCAAPGPGACACKRCRRGMLRPHLARAATPEQCHA